jgi:hypothetical protein
MLSKIIRFLIYFVPFALTLYLIQNYIITNVLNEIVFFNSTHSIYLFHFVVVVISYVSLVVINRFFFSQTGYAFLAFGVLKMVFSVVFLMPLVKSNLEDKVPDVLAFFVPFFFFLFFETIQSIRLLNQDQLKEK